MGRNEKRNLCNAMITFVRDWIEIDPRFFFFFFINQNFNYNALNAKVLSRFDWWTSEVVAKRWRRAFFVHSLHLTTRMQQP